MAIYEYGGTVVECLSTDTKPSKPDGWFLKEMDTGFSYIRKAGMWTDINLGLAFVRATKSGSVVTDGSGLATIIFSTPFASNQYSIALSCNDVGAGPGVIAYKYNKLGSGFDIVTRNPVSGLPKPGITVSWLCTLDYNP